MSDEGRVVDGTARIEQLLADPRRAQRVEQIRQDGERMDRAFEMIREAGRLTQETVATRFGVKHSEVAAKPEDHDDWVLATLLDNLRASGAEGPRIVVTVHGHEVEIDLAAVAAS